MNKSWNSLETGLVVKDDEEEDLEEGQRGRRKEKEERY